MAAKIFSFCNQKGGVGKTTSAVNVATFAAQQGLRVLLVDLDSQGNATSGLGIEKADLEFTAYQLLVDKNVHAIIVELLHVTRGLPSFTTVPHDEEWDVA